FGRNHNVFDFIRRYSMLGNMAYIPGIPAEFPHHSINYIVYSAPWQVDFSALIKRQIVIRHRQDHRVNRRAINRPHAAAAVPAPPMHHLARTFPADRSIHLRAGRSTSAHTSPRGRWSPAECPARHVSPPAAPPPEARSPKYRHRSAVGYTASLPRHFATE